MPINLTNRYNSYSPEYSHHLAEQVTKHEGLYYWILSWLGRAIPVFDAEHNKIVYLRLQELVAKLCEMPLSRASTEEAAASEDLQRLALETLQPVMSEPITLEKVDALFRDFRTVEVLKQLQAKDAAGGMQAAAAQFEKLKARNVKVLTFTAGNILNNLKPGDILFKKLPHSSTNPVVLGQWFFSFFKSGVRERESYKFSHALLYLGAGKFAEASPNHGQSEVRIFNMHDPKFRLDSSSEAQYLVARHHDSEIAENAAKIASQIAENAATGSGDHNYEYIHALRSIYLSSDFGRFGRYRYFKQYYLDRHGEKPIDAIGHKNFFCSYLVGYSYQTAESRKVMPQIVADPDAAPPKGSSAIASWFNRGIWTHPKISTYWQAMTDKIKLKFDAKRITPQDFRDFITRERGIFKDVLLLRPPQASV